MCIRDRHDVVAFTRCVSESLGDEKKWVHYGLTSTDVVDTAYGYLYKQVNAILREDLERYISILKKQAYRYKDTVMIGRTHGVPVSYTHLDVYKRQLMMHQSTMPPFFMKQPRRVI